MTLKEHLGILKRAVKMCVHLDKRFLICLIVEPVLLAAAIYIPVYFSAKVIDALYARSALQVTARYVLLAVGLSFLIRLLYSGVKAVHETASNTVYRKEDWSYSEKAMQMAYESLEDAEVTRLLYRNKKESMAGYNLYFFYNVTERFFGNMTKIVASSAMCLSFFALASVGIEEKLFMIAGLLIIIIVISFVTIRESQRNQKFYASNVEMNVLDDQLEKYIENYGAGKDIRLYHMEDCLAREYRKWQDSYCERYGKTISKKVFGNILVTILEYSFMFSVYVVLIHTAFEGGITVGSIAKYIACIMLFIKAAADMIKVVLRALDNDHYLKRFFMYFDIANPMYKGTLTVEKRDDNDYQVEFCDVSFRYPNTESYALSHVSIKFKLGEKMAIVGENGSGKTTFIKLLCRLYDPCEGEILLNGVNIQKYDYEEYMSIFSVVFQDFSLLSFKLGEVVASDRKFNESKVKACLEKVNFGGRYDRLEKGADTYLYKDYDKDGIEISGGEAQKLALARALYKDAPFILLDEPTAALDPISEYEVYSNFNNISGDKTVVYISHRLASCRFCDKIVVFDKGEIVQIGTHEKLLQKKDGKYGELWHAQAVYYCK